MRSLDLVGTKHFGMDIIEYIGGRRGNKERKAIPPRFKIICRCGDEYTPLVESVKKGQAKSCTKCSVGHNHHNFKGYGEIKKKIWNQIIRGCTKRSREIKIDIDIKYAWGLFLEQDRKCAITGIVIDFGTTVRKNDQTASLDRIDSSKGYIEGNVQWVHKVVNRMKWDMEQEDFINWCKVISENNRS